MTESPAPVVASSTGLISSLRGLVGPLHFTPRTPTAAAEVYGPRHRGIAPLADVYLPDTPGPHPSVVLTHGGGFFIGSRAMKPMRLLATRLAEAGFAVMTFDYRMILRGGRLTEAVADTAAAATWWQSQAARFSLRPDGVALMGLSAGAALTVLAAARLPATSFDRVVGVFGPYDFSALRGRRAALARKMLLRTNDPAAWRDLSPITAAAQVPHPMLLIHGTGDGLVPVEHTRWLAARRAELGLPVQTHYIEGAPHGFFNQASLEPAATSALSAILPFLGAAP